MKAIAYYKLERSTTIETSERLLGSRTIVAAIVAQFKLGLLNPLGIFLILLWVLSPFGGQASLRVGEFTSGSDNSQFPFQYLDFRTYYSPYDSTFSLTPVNVFYVSALATPAKTRELPQDLWGNVRVPRIEALDSKTADEDGWIPFMPNANSEYSAILGIPISGPSLGNNTITNTSIATSYWVWDCDTIPFSLPINGNIPYTGSTWFNVSVNPFSIVVFNAIDDGVRRIGNITLLSMLPDITDDDLNQANFHYRDGYPVTPRQLILIPFSLSNVTTKSTCNLTTTYVNMKVSCQGSSCQPVAIQQVNTSASVKNISTLDFIGENTMHFFQYFFEAATNMGRWPSSDVWTSPTFGYISNPNSPFDYSGDQTYAAPNWSAVTAPDFSLRLSQLLNTYWLASIGYGPLLGVYQRNNSGDAFHTSYFALINGTGSREDMKTVFATSFPWVAILFLASGAMFFAALGSAALGILRRAPDTLDNFSSLVKDSRFVDYSSRNSGSSVLDGFDRAGLLRDVRIRIGDVKPHDRVGYIAIATLGDDSSSKLEHSRLYG